jgi:hypothetical protein
MKKLFTLMFAAMLLIPSWVFADGTVTQTYTLVKDNVVCLTQTWTADASAATAPATSSTSDIDGYLTMVVTNPGTTAPTDDYDITLTDSDAIDVMDGALADRDEANSEVEGQITLNISNIAVNGTTGVVKVYHQR